MVVLILLSLLVLLCDGFGTVVQQSYNRSTTLQPFYNSTTVLQPYNHSTTKGVGTYGHPLRPATHSEAVLDGPCNLEADLATRFNDTVSLNLQVVTTTNSTSLVVLVVFRGQSKFAQQTIHCHSCKRELV
jgi:hypothetical protein